MAGVVRNNRTITLCIGLILLMLQLSRKARAK
jgi:hypothetical protein